MTEDPSRQPDAGVGYAANLGNWSVEPTDAGPLRALVAVAGQEYRLSIRNRWGYALTALFGALALLVVGFGGTSVGPGRIEAVVVSLAAIATYLVPLAALAFGYDIVVGADDAGWLDVVFALPVRRGQVVIGSYLGRAATLAGATVLGFGFGGVLMILIAGALDAAMFVRVIIATMLFGLAFLSIGTFVSAVAPRKTNALGGILLVWVWFAFIHDLLALGLIAAVELPELALSMAVLLNPAAVYRVIVLTGVKSAGGGFAAAVATTGLSGPLLWVAMALWIAGPLWAAAEAVKRRSV